MVENFRELNEGFEKKHYDRCINCWMDTLYSVERHPSDKMHRFLLQNLLILVRADIFMYREQVVLKQPCVICKGSSTLGKVPYFKLASYK